MAEKAKEVTKPAKYCLVENEYSAEKPYSWKVERHQFWWFWETVYKTTDRRYAEAKIRELVREANRKPAELETIYFDAEGNITAA